jgi:hypothetical protein
VASRRSRPSTRPWPRKDALTRLRVVLLVTDEPALTHAVSPQCVLDALRQADVLCNVISPDIAYYRKMAEATGGSWLRIASHVDMAGLIAALGATWVHASLCAPVASPS